MNDKDVFEYNNEEEAEMAQIQSIITNQSAVDKVRAAMAKQAERESAEFCEECGDEIPLQRRKLIPGVQLCVYCKERSERRV